VQTPVALGSACGAVEDARHAEKNASAACTIIKSIASPTLDIKSPEINAAGRGISGRIKASILATTTPSITLNMLQLRK
jgi:hypothetical protein